MGTISEHIKNRIEAFSVKPQVYRYGTVSSSSDGVVWIEGLRDRVYGELIEFEDGAYGMVMELMENGVGAVLLDNDDKVGVGDTVRGTSLVCEIPVDDSVIGRVVDPVGRALDGKPYEGSVLMPCERPAPKIIDRQGVGVPLETGIVAIDSMIPIGRGQRELIIGDRQTGKTSIAVDTIINQKGKNVICVYCAIGQKASTVEKVVRQLESAGATDYTFVVASTASDSPAMQYLAPYSACSAAEYFMEKGRDVLIVYDDLSKHAVAYRTISLLLRRSPGREAYPSDVFYLHSRLLERAAKLSHERGGGSLTALPIIETSDGDISSYIPTNVISITDGQIYLDGEAFRSGIRPAVNTGLSVSRVGRAAQTPAMRKVSSTLRIDLAQYREMSVFARFGAELDSSTKKLLDRGEKLTRLFIQKNARPYSLSEETALLIGHAQGLFANTGIEVLSENVENMLSYLKRSLPEITDKIDATGNFDERDKNAIVEKITEFFEKEI